MTYSSNGIEGNTLTLKETKVVLEGITIGVKSVRELLEAINHEKAIEYLEELIGEKSEISEWNIKKLHQLVLKGINDANAGRYRNHDVIISGAQHRLHNIKVPELMEKLIMNYDEWYKYHSIVRAVLLHGELVKIHPFIEGNTRTVAIFIIKYLEFLEYNIDITLFKDNSIYYRSALVRSNYFNNHLNIKENNSFLIKFYEMLILGKNNNLRLEELVLEESINKENKKLFLEN